MATGTLEDLEKFGKALIGYKQQEKLFQKQETLDRLLSPSQPSMSQEKKDIGGIYGSARTFERGYGRLHSIISRVKIKEEDDGVIKLIGPGFSFEGYEFEPSLYNVDGTLYQIYKDKDGSMIMSTIYQDFYRLKTSRIIIDYGLVILAILALLYSIISLLVDLLDFIRTKRNDKVNFKDSLFKFHIFTYYLY